MTDTVYTALSFAPVQGFIEKSRKLRDLYGASLILSYLSQAIVVEFDHPPDFQVISPALPTVQEGMPNRILIKGSFIERSQVRQLLVNRWRSLLEVCRTWVEQVIPGQYHWSQAENQKEQVKGEWERWDEFTWEVFWGSGATPQAAMDDLETRKLKRDWVGINWSGESSSLSGTDAIAWPHLGHEHSSPGRSLTESDQEDLERFYLQLAWILDDIHRTQQSFPSDAELKAHFASDDNSGKFITHRERLSIPELAKRLVTLPSLANRIGMTPLDDGFKDIYRKAGYWTGWFMGDGDHIGKTLKELADRHANDPEQRDQDLKTFTESLRNWGTDFKATEKTTLFTEGSSRVVYAGGDDFLGILYSAEADQGQANPEMLKPAQIWDWLVELPKQWEAVQAQMKTQLNLTLTYSVGFVWVGHQVPQRDILQHCREAEKRSKQLGRDRLTIRVLFNSGQYVQWTCPWSDLKILNQYCDRNQATGAAANWNHIYSDWATLKDRHAIQLDPDRHRHSESQISKDVAMKLFDLYFQEAASRFEQERRWEDLVGDNSDLDIMTWMDDLIQVGWQLCRNSTP